jgi:hypothetical protein
MLMVATYASSGGKSPFWNWLQGVPPYPKELAWCHTTDSFALRSILKAGALQPCPCPVFAEDLLYFFYGRPGYRFQSDSSLHISARGPVVIVFAPELSLGGKRLFPFDTGAFSGKRYSTWMHESMSMSDFELECPSDAPQRHVTSFFGTNGDYLRARVRPPPKSYSGEFEVDSMFAMLTDRNTNSADDRRVAVELQTASAVPIRHPYVKAIVLPDELLQAAFIQEFIAGPGTDVELFGYELSPLKQAREYQALLEEKAALLQQEWGMT